MQFSPDDIEYAMKNSHILVEPSRRIDTFGMSKFNFLLLSERMDEVGVVRIRKGEIEASKPLIIKPQAFNNVELEGFDEQAQALIDMMESKGMNPYIFRYGFNFKRTKVTEDLLYDNFENIKDRVLEESKKEGDPMLAVLECVDDTWEIGLLKFAIDMISKSSEINTFDFKRKGLL